MDVNNDHELGSPPPYECSCYLDPPPAYSCSAQAIRGSLVTQTTQRVTRRSCCMYSVSDNPLKMNPKTLNVSLWLMVLGGTSFIIGLIVFFVARLGFTSGIWCGTMSVAAGKTCRVARNSTRLWLVVATAIVSGLAGILAMIQVLLEIIDLTKFIDIACLDLQLNPLCGFVVPTSLLLASGILSFILNTWLVSVCIRYFCCSKGHEPLSSSVEIFTVTTAYNANRMT